jgi:hypothetical protein
VTPLLALSALAGLAAVAAEPEGGYAVARAAAPRGAILAGEEAAWAKAAAVTWGPPAYATAFRALWSDEGLFLRFDATDPDPWHTMTRRDEHLWEEEVVEIFLDLDSSGRDYYELEISPANVVCDLRMISPWPDKKGDASWDLAGLSTRVRTHKGATGKTTGWTATALLPWSGFRSLPSARAIGLPPKPGDRWRFNLFRIKRPGGKQAPEKDAVEVAWSPTGEPSFHVPRAFRDLVFTRAAR